MQVRADTVTSLRVYGVALGTTGLEEGSTLGSVTCETPILNSLAFFILLLVGKALTLLVRHYE